MLLFIVSEFVNLTIVNVAVENACKPILTLIHQHEHAKQGAREYDILDHRPEKKSYKENQLGDITDAMKTAPAPRDAQGQAVWIDRCSWGGILPSLDAIICKEMHYFSSTIWLQVEKLD